MMSGTMSGTMRWFLVCLITVSCATGRKRIHFSDDSEDNKVGWVCVPESAESWRCVSLETFTEYLRQREDR